MKKLYLYGFSDTEDKIIHFFENMGIKVSGILSDTEKSDKSIISLSESNITQIKNEVVFIGHQNPLIAVARLKEKGFTNIYRLTDFSRGVEKDFFYPKQKEAKDFRKVHPFNHYESPYADLDYIKEHCDQIWNKQKEISEIDFNMNGQLELINKMRNISLPDWKEKDSDRYIYRYYYNNGWFAKGAALGLYYMMRIYQPKRIIEIGSGFSTAVMLDTNENYLNNQVEIYCIEPRADRLRSIVKEKDNIKINECDLQSISMDIFDQLEENDFLFIDSSHVGKTGSDVNIEIFEILPRLKSGVIIHFHDMHWPFEYDREWIIEGRAYNELFYIRALLMGNRNYKILLFGAQVKALCETDYSMGEIGDKSLWIQKSDLYSSSGEMAELKKKINILEKEKEALMLSLSLFSQK